MQSSVLELVTVFPVLQVFKTVGRPLVDAVFSGFNGTLMAYGQTGTGKTKISLL